MTHIEISKELKDWAELAGYSLTPADSSGAAVFWTDPGGEIRFYVRNDESHSFTLTTAERSLPEQFELLGTSMHVVERYLFGVFGTSVRARQRLSRLPFASREDDVAPGYSVEMSDPDGYWSLLNAEGLVAKARGRVGMAALVKLSHLLSASARDVMAAFLDPEGQPLRG